MRFLADMGVAGRVSEWLRHAEHTFSGFLQRKVVETRPGGILWPASVGKISCAAAFQAAGAG